MSQFRSITPRLGYSNGMATAGSGMVMHIVDSSLWASAAVPEKVKPNFCTRFMTWDESKDMSTINARKPERVAWVRVSLIPPHCRVIMFSFLCLALI